MSEHRVVRLNRQRVLIVGAGGHGREIAAYVQDILRGGWDGRFLGYLDDEPGLNRLLPQCIGRLDVFADRPPEFFHDLYFLTAMGDNAARRRVVETLARLYGDRLLPWTLVHPTCYVGEHVEIGFGTCLAPGALVTCKSRIGRHCIVNVKASVSHDCTIGDFVNLNPAVTVCGHVTVGEGAYIGAGATIIDRVSVGAGAVVGAGSVVIQNVPPDVTAVGVPARVIKQNLVSV
jgi:sugar O-acyltransferase (sialic acid O-acetyltransferase NeuD family)